MKFIFTILPCLLLFLTQDVLVESIMTVNVFVIIFDVDVFQYDLEFIIYSTMYRANLLLV